MRKEEGWSRIIPKPYGGIAKLPSKGMLMHNIMYEAGRNATKDQWAKPYENLKMALVWYEKAASQGHQEAIEKVKKCRETGMTETKPDALSQGTILNGQEVFENAMEYYNTEDYSNALRLFQQAAMQGHAVAQFNLGVIYANGEGVTQDYAEAVRWYLKAAEQGVVGAQFNLGVRYDSGEGVAQDKAEAVRWWRKAAEQGNAAAQGNLGFAYARGNGVPKDRVKAKYWWQKMLENENASENQKIVIELMLQK